MCANYNRTMNAITFSVNFLIILLVVFSAASRATFTCTQKGFVEDPNSTDCTGFIYCNENLQPSNSKCGSDSSSEYGVTYFWPEKEICFSYYNCSTKSLPNNDNTVDFCVDFMYTTVADRYAIDCSSYIKGEYDMFNIPIASKIECPVGTYYQPDGRGCTSDYVCPNYKCQAEGYVPNPASSDCSTFISCETYMEYGCHHLVPFVVTCPSNTKFSPYLMKCDSYYTCGGSDPHQGVDPCNNYDLEAPFTVNNLENDCDTFFRCEQRLNDNKNYYVIVKESCPTNTHFSPLLTKCYYNHVCNAGCSKDPCQSGNGRYVDFRTSDCQTFLECQNDDQTGQTYMPSIGKRYCPDGSLFNPTISHCDQSYVCQPPQSNFCYVAVPTTTTPMVTAGP